ncbi:hypothetical protein FRC01_007412 [Tulasnella sp. 417]|nr:hypothetical protein FRC01_007412 [Tulasnella sp. 417]
MTDSLEAPTRTDSPATRDAAVPTLVLLPDDLIVEILVLFDVREILSLRQVCKAFAQATRLRALWVRLAHREVLDRNLLWPAYAFPLAFATRRTIEAHTLRAIGVDRQKPPRMFSQERRFSRCIFRPPNSVGWLRVVKGRWLILELRGQQLEVWDLQNKLETEPAALYDGLKGKIDGSSIDISEGSSVVLSFSES